MTPEQRAARIHHHMYETCEGIAEHAERIVRLEELVTVMYRKVRRAAIDGSTAWYELKDLEASMRELGIEELV